ncbi:MAG: PAS domain S-box protein, partial [Gemmataceae bacterium]
AGQHVDVSISVTPEETHGEDVGVAAIERAVTARKATARRRNARLAITQILATEKDIGEAGRRILEAVCRGLQWDLSCLWLVDPASDVLRCRETWADPERHLDEFERASRALVFHRGDNFPGRIWASGDPEWVPDVVDDPDFHRAEPARQAGFHGAFAFPVTSGDEVLGVVEFFSRDVREPDADLLEMMTTIGGQMGQFLKQCQIEQNLRRSEAELADFFENATIGLHWVNPEGIVIRVNQAELDMLGYRREEYLGHHIAEFHADPPVIEDILQRLSRGETLHELPARLRCKDGAIKQVMISSNVYREAGRFVHTRCFTRDVTIQKQVEQSLRESEKRFRTLAFNAPAAIFIKDLEGRYTFANKLACETLNRPEGLVGCTDRELMPAESAAGLEQHDREVIATGQPIETVEHVLGPGFDFQFLSVKFPLTDDHGQIEGVCGVAVDITGRMHAEKRLLESERRFAALAELVPQLVWTAGPDGNVDYFNQRWYDYTGAIYEQSVGDGWVEFVHPDDRATSLKHWQESLRTGTPAEVEHRMRSASGSYSWFLVRGVPVRDDSQRIVKWFGTCTNIDTHKRVERSVRFLADASAALASLVDYESTLQRVAKLAVPFVADWCFVDMLEADGSLRPVAVAHGDPERVKLARAILAREPARDNGFAPPFDEPRIVEQPVKTWPLAGELGLRALLQVPMRSRGRTMGLLTFASAESARLLGQPDLALAEDLAHRAAIAIENARLYQETREADRRKDEFLATLAHELRNPLAPISNCVQIMQHRQLEDPQLQWAQDIIGRQVRHLARLVDDLLDISRITRGKFRLRSESLELVALVERAIENSRAAIAEKNLNFEVKLPDAPVPMVGDATRLEQVLSNLLSNASKYTEPGGSITLTMTRDEAGVTIRVRDTGIGIDNELVEHVFDMFVQADHGAQGGLGIGLSLVKRLVEMHGGEVTAQSAGKGQGSEFIVRLPVRAGTTCTQTRDEQIREQRPPQRILVVDDNVDAADSLAALLRLQGHEVRIAHDGPDGLELAEQFHPQLVFLDLGMPHMDGFEVASRLQQNLAAAILIAVTGWGQQQDRQRTRQAGFHHHLVKPVTPEVLNDLLDHLLG